MTGEIGERGRHREGQDELDDDIEKMMKDITDEIEKELEQEQQEGRDCDEDPNEAMRKAIKELEEEEEERRRTYEEYLGKIREKEEERERARQEREESADEDSLDEFEKKELERMRKRGEDPEDVLKRWREQYVREVEDYIGDTPEAKEKDDEREDVGPTSEKPADDLSYFDDGSSQMYATKREHKEETDGEPESESEKDAASKEPKKERERTNPCETEAKPAEVERTKSDAEDIDSEPRPSPETSKPGETDESFMEKRAHRELPVEGVAEREMEEEAESGSPATDKKKEFYDQPEEEWRRKYRERFEEREEDEKEEFREVLIDQVKEKEDVEKLARKHDYESILEDEEAIVEIEEYLRIKKKLEDADEHEIEELSKELGVDSKALKEGDLRDILPDSLKELLNREGDELWREIDRKFIERFYPEDAEYRLPPMLPEDFSFSLFPESEEEIEKRESKEIWESMSEQDRELLKPLLVKDIESEDDLHELLERFGEVRASPDFASKHDETLEFLSGEPDPDAEIPKLIETLQDLESERRWIALLHGLAHDSSEGHVTEEEASSISAEAIEGAEVDEVLEVESGSEITTDKPRREETIPAHLDVDREWTLGIVLPAIKGKSTPTEEELQKLIDEEYPWLKKQGDYKDLLHGATAFIGIYHRTKRLKKVPYGLVSKLAREYKLNPRTVSGWVLDGHVPLMFQLMRKGLSAVEGQRFVTKRLEKLNGIKSWSDAKQRLSRSFMYDYLKNWPTHTKDVKELKDYFRLIRALRNGGPISHVASKLGMKQRTALSYLDEQRIPRLLRIARCIPKEKPKRGYRWLPLIVTSARDFKALIQVPLEIRNLNNLKTVISQLRPLESKSMRKWEKKYHRPSPLVAFMYTLGLLVSDASFSTPQSRISGEISLCLSKTYPWSKDVGEAWRYYLGLLGFETTRRKDTKERGSTSEAYRWETKSSPFFVWLRSMLLEPADSKTKSKRPIKAEWIHSLSAYLKTAFIQGVADGDGFASIRAHAFGISTRVNQELIQQVLASLGMEMRTAFYGVTSDKVESIHRAAELPLFRFASGRQKRLEEMSRLRKAMKRKVIEGEEAGIILRLHREGFTTGEISSILWAEYGIPRTPNGLRAFIKRHGLH